MSKVENGVNSRLRYVLVTPARNEVAFIELTLKSVIAQTHRPLKWVIVSDGSTDGTDAVVRKYADQHAWIELVARPPRTDRNFAGKAGAFKAGWERLHGLDYDVIGNLDGDISFDADYFEFLMTKFAENEQIGVAGTPYMEGNSTYDYRVTSLEHVSGACQLFRRQCFEKIGGYHPVKSGGIDLIAVLSARACGWQTRTFAEKVCIHHRKMGAAHHTGFKERMHRGRMDYLLGSHPIWEIFRSLYQMKNRPYVIGGFLIIGTYTWMTVRRVERTMPPHLMKLRRREQLSQLGVIARRLVGGSAAAAVSPKSPQCPATR